MKLTIHTGHNQPFPMPTLPHCGDSLSYRFKLGPEWWEGELTNPLRFGCKLPAIGKLNYHRGGMNSAIIYQDGEVYWYPRYYAPTTTGVYRLYELTDYKIKLQPDRWYDICMESQPATWFFNFQPVSFNGTYLPHGWIVWMPYVGRSGKDNNYGGDPIPASYASRNLTMEIKR